MNYRPVTEEEMKELCSTNRFIFYRWMRGELMKKYRPMNREEKEELRLLRELAQAKGKTLCTMQDMMRIMGRKEFMDAVFDKKIVSCGSIGQRSYYLY